MKILFASLALLVALSGPADAVQWHERSGGTPIPPAAAAVGYTTNTYHVGPFTTSNVDTAETYASGYKLYIANFFGTTDPTSTVTLNADGTASVTGLGDSIASTGYIHSAPYYVGTAIGCGGYVTAEIGFNAAAVDTSQDWPAWWAMSVEHMSQLSSQQWPGQAAGYDHFAEVDELEYLKPDSYADTYSAAWHDWYGIYSTSPCNTGQYCDVSPSPYSNVYAVTPVGTDFTLYHRVAFLWVPATSSTNGYLKFYFDDEPIGTELQWTQFTTQSPPPTANPPINWTMGILDQQHLTLILSGSGNVAMNVRSIDVWQNSATACNLVN